MFTKEAINGLTNAAGTIIGVPDIIEGAIACAAGDYIHGGFKILKGVSEFVGFYFIGK